MELMMSTPILKAYEPQDISGIYDSASMIGAYVSDSY